MPLLYWNNYNNPTVAWQYRSVNSQDVSTRLWYWSESWRPRSNEDAISSTKLLSGFAPHVFSTFRKPSIQATVSQIRNNTPGLCLSMYRSRQFHLHLQPSGMHDFINMFLHKGRSYSSCPSFVVHTAKFLRENLGILVLHKKAAGTFFKGTRRFSFSVYELDVTVCIGCF